VFFALWPDIGTRDRLVRAATVLHGACGGRMPKAENMHLTLAFLGQIQRSRLDGLRAVAGRVSGRSHGLPVERFGWFRRNRVAWAGPLRTPGALIKLVSSLEDALRQNHFPFDGRPYEAHITLLRKASCREVPGMDEPFEWPVREFVLVESELNEAGSIYTTIGRWPLG
jgi:2'-5' RNA ligase